MRGWKPPPGIRISPKQRLDLVTSSILAQATAGQNEVNINLWGTPESADTTEYLIERARDLARVAIQITNGGNQHER